MAEIEVTRELLDEVKYLLQNMPFALYTGIVFDEIETDHATVHVDLSRKLGSPYGAAHGGLIYTLVDCVAGAVARADGKQYVTLNASINYIHSTYDGRLTAVGIPVKRGRTTTIVDVRVTDDQGRLAATATSTMFCMGETGPRAHVVGLEEPDPEGAPGRAPGESDENS